MLTLQNAACISFHVMNAIQFHYSDFSSAALIAIFQLADLLGVTPKRASEIYLLERSKTATETSTEEAA